MIQRMPILILSLFATTACNNTTFSSGLSPDQDVGELSSEEQQLYCDSLSEFVTDVAYSEMTQSIVCYSLGLTALVSGMMGDGQFSESGESCDEVYAACMEAEIIENYEAPTFPCNEADWQACSISVGELEACISELTAVLDEMEDKLSCNVFEMLSDGSSEEFLSVAQVQSCVSVAANCAAFLPNVDTTVATEPGS